MQLSEVAREYETDRALDSFTRASPGSIFDRPGRFCLVISLGVSGLPGIACAEGLAADYMLGATQHGRAATSKSIPAGFIPFTRRSSESAPVGLSIPRRYSRRGHWPDSIAFGTANGNDVQRDKCPRDCVI